MRLWTTLGIGAVSALGVLSCDRSQPVVQPPPDLEQEPVSQMPVLQAAAPAAIAAMTPLTAPEPEAPCPANMVLVEGEYCPKVRHSCKDYMDPKGTYEYFRCTEYRQPAKCLAETVTKRFCIDRDEYTPEGEALPENFRSWTHARDTCDSLGKRVCLESEWNFACEGEEMRPYPYGWKRDATACNADHTDITTAGGTLKDMRAPADAYPRCVSPFGVRNLTGNLEEFTTIDRTTPERPAMKGAYWQPGRNHCRAAQTAHDRYYNGTETGFRCCSDPE